MTKIYKLRNRNISIWNYGVKRKKKVTMNSNFFFIFSGEWDTMWKDSRKRQGVTSFALINLEALHKSLKYVHAYFDYK